MTSETQAKYDKRQTWIFAVVLLLGIIGAIYWLMSRGTPDNPPAPPAVTVITSPLGTPTASNTPIPPTNTPISSATPTSTDMAPPTATPSPSPTLIPSLPEDTPTATPPPAQTSIPESNRCVGVQGGDFYQIQTRDSLWSIWLAHYCGVEWSVWLEATLEMNQWISKPDLIHPTGETGHRLWLPLFEGE